MRALGVCSVGSVCALSGRCVLCRVGVCPVGSVCALLGWCVLCRVDVQGSTAWPCGCAQTVLQGGRASKRRLGVHGKGADAVNPAGEGLGGIAGA